MTHTHPCTHTYLPASRTHGHPSTHMHVAHHHFRDDTFGHIDECIGCSLHSETSGSVLNKHTAFLLSSRQIARASLPPCVLRPSRGCPPHSRLSHDSSTVLPMALITLCSLRSDGPLHHSDIRRCVYTFADCIRDSEVRRVRRRDHPTQPQPDARAFDDEYENGNLSEDVISSMRRKIDRLSSLH